MAEWQVVCNKCGAVNISQVINKRIKELESEVESEKLRADLWMRYHDELKENREIIKNKLSKAEDILKERDGGGHDADCKIFRMVAKCNCGHQDVLDYFKDKS